LGTPSNEARERAELRFRKKEVQAREASKAMADYQAHLAAERDKTARLRALREAKEAADEAAKAANAPDGLELKNAAKTKANSRRGKTSSAA